MPRRFKRTSLTSRSCWKPIAAVRFLYASQRKWQQATAEYARASELDPEEPYFWWYQALLNQALGDEDSYRRICVAMLERFGTTADPRTAHSVASACTLRQMLCPI